MDAREQAAQVIVACREEARAAWRNPVWVRRRRMGDPTAVPDVIARACARLQVSDMVVQTTIRSDPTLSRLLESTINAAQSEAEVEAAHLRRSHIILALAAGGFALCIIALIVYVMCQHEVDRHLQSQHPAQKP